MRCPYCKAEMEQEMLNYKVQRGEAELLIEDVPTWVCPDCDATVIDNAVGEAVEEMLNQLDGGFGDSDEEIMMTIEYVYEEGDQ